MSSTMTFTRTAPTPLADTAAGVLDAVRETRAARDREDARLLVLAVQWAVLHPEESTHGPGTFLHGDRPVVVAGAGAPLVGEFAVAELAAALRMPTEAGRDLVGEALELCHRLPRLWARVQDGTLPAWRARRIARATMLLSRPAAGYVDDRVASFAHRVGPSTVDRLVEEALVRFDPVAANERALASADHRHVHVHTDQVDSRGTVHVSGDLDLADALDLDHALDDGAARLAALGDGRNHQARRATALGELARQQPALDLPADTGPRPSRRGRELVLHVHLSDSALGGSARDDGGLELARVENTRSFVTAEQVRAWCGTAGARVTVWPVLDLAEQIRVDAYEIPDRLAEQVRLRDGTCAFPWCRRTARACDLDHVTPYDRGGSTSSDNLAALCRRHHRLKTFGGWSYTTSAPGRFTWTSPHGHRYRRDRHGTVPLDPDP
jgi:hypothetical protein